MKANQNNIAARGTFESSVALFANVVAFAAAFLATGPVYAATVIWVRDYAVSQYGAWIADLTTLVWLGIVGIAIFAFSRASLATGITLGGLAIAARLF